MNENLLLSLQITALGMGLVFAAIIVLTLMMSMLTRFVANQADKNNASSVGSPKGTMSDSPEPAPVTLTPTPSPSGRGEHKAQAAALAVAIALTELSLAQPIPEPPTAAVSPWQMGMRTRQMYEKGGR